MCGLLFEVVACIVCLLLVVGHSVVCCSLCVASLMLFVVRCSLFVVRVCCCVLFIGHCLSFVVCYLLLIRGLCFVLRY